MTVQTFFVWRSCFNLPLFRQVWVTFGQNFCMKCLDLKKFAQWNAIVCFFEIIFFGVFFGQLWWNLGKSSSHPQNLPAPTSVLSFTICNISLDFIAISGTTSKLLLFKCTIPKWSATSFKLIRQLKLDVISYILTWNSVCYNATFKITCIWMWTFIHWSQVQLASEQYVIVLLECVTRPPLSNF